MHTRIVLMCQVAVMPVVMNQSTNTTQRSALQRRTLPLQSIKLSLQTFRIVKLVTVTLCGYSALYVMVMLKGCLCQLQISRRNVKE